MYKKNIDISRKCCIIYTNAGIYKQYCFINFHFFIQGGIILPRVARKDLNTPFLHVMVQGVNKEYIFNKESYIKEYLNIIDKLKKDYNITFIAYCIMNNHAHFLVYVKDIKEFGKFMQKVNLRYSNLYNREENRCGVIFRNRYRTESISDIKYLINCIKYIHENPVKAGIVQKCEDYKFSSYKDYINNVGLTQSEIMKNLFGTNCNYDMLFNKSIDKRFIDIEEKRQDEIKKYILGEIRNFQVENNKELVDIFSNKTILKELIMYLKIKCNFKYKEIQNTLEMSRRTIDEIKR